MLKIKYYLFMFFLLMSCSRRYSVHIENTIVPKSFDLDFWEQKDYLTSNQNRQIVSGRLNYNSRGIEKSFSLCLEDLNDNGSYTDFGVDAIGITEDTSVVIHGMLNGAFFGTASLLKRQMTFNYEDDLFEVTSVDTVNAVLEVRYIGEAKDRRVQDFQLTKYLPNLVLNDLFTNKEFRLYNRIDKSKKWHLVVFWARWCTSCIDEFPLLKELSEDYSLELINLCNVTRTDDTVEARETVITHNVPGIHAISNVDAERAIHQNAFPYLMLYDSTLQKVNRIFPIEELVNIVAKDE